MPEQAPQIPNPSIAEHHVVRLTPEQAEQLAQMNSEQLKDFGHVALDGSKIGLVVDTDEQGNEVPGRLINLGKDAGTPINRNLAGNDQKYPSEQDAFTQLKSQEASVTTQTEQDPAIESALEKGNFEKAFKAFATVEQTQSDGAANERRAIDEARMNFRTLLRQFDEVSQQNRGSRLGESPQLRRYSNQLMEQIAQADVVLRRNGKVSEESMNHLRVEFAEVQAKVEAELAATKTKQAEMVRATVGNAAEVTKMAASRMADNDQIRSAGISRLNNTLQSILGNPNARVADVMNDLMMVQKMFNNLEDEAGRRGADVSRVREAMSGLRAILEKQKTAR